MFLLEQQPRLSFSSTGTVAADSALVAGDSNRGDKEGEKRDDDGVRRKAIDAFLPLFSLSSPAVALLALHCDRRQ